MATTSISIRMDSELKKQFEEFCEDVGLTMTAAVTVFAKRAVRENRIPFDVTADIPNEVTRQAIENAINGVNLSRPFSTVEELMEYLDADD